MNGSEWIESVRDLGSDRAALMDAVLDAVCKKLDVRWPMHPIDAGNGVIFYASTDYFAIGNVDDFVYVPLDPVTAETICRSRDWTFPTKKMVELIFEQSDLKIFATSDGKGAGPWGPLYNEQMYSVDRIARFNVRTQKQIDKNGRKKDHIYAGHRKDLVLSNVLENHPDRLAYFGWFREDGTTIQGPYVGASQHHKSYFDYSHGFRPIFKTCHINGLATPLTDILKSEKYHSGLCGIDRINGKIEPLRVTRFPIGEEAWPTSEGLPDTDRQPGISRRVIVALPTLRLSNPFMRDRSGGEIVIARLQKAISVTADGVFGPNTSSKLKVFQTANDLHSDGVCGRATWAVVFAQETDAEEIDPYDDGMDHDNELSIAFIQAKSYRRSNRGKGDIDWIVIHTMEASEHPGTAENVASWFGGPNHPAASAHYNIDCDSIVQSVREKDIGHHAPGCNRRGIGLEHAGYARQGDNDQGWQDEYSQRMLRLSAKIAARISQRYDIPVQFVGANDLRAGKRGITYHSEASRAFKKSTHYDPGKHFPITQYLEMTLEELSLISS